ncbi:putative toxin-antitoxin system toxin component, PIN family [Methylophilus aquaticus]|uniref:Toxin-antitoxin system toxin component, PIN family n=1 Tax=Methylophilus aquaticus TaxID=1971610 RepID=A0ABT9JU26_9PROT|nr:putative toxin-antitoxin system toxin component, PIN family [Methylophilus aquaticus]MDP8568043.1 putative toxin-antitoxin system toxin component, PIN family [Methylophilus aquaticus]
MRVVFDTSLLVAAIRSKQGASYALISSLPNPQFEICLSVALYVEWQAVLTRVEHLPPGQQPENALAFLRYLASISHLQDIYYLWRPQLRDPNDDMVLELAVASQAEYIVTHNVRDFQNLKFDIQAISPGEFLTQLRRKE